MPTRQETALIVFPISIFAGWITIAGLANTSSWLANAGGFGGWGIPHGTWVAGLALVGGLAAAATIRTNRGNVFYAAVVVWGLSGVAIKCARLSDYVAVGGAVPGIGIAVAMSAWIMWRELRDASAVATNRS